MRWGGKSLFLGQGVTQAGEVAAGRLTWHWLGRDAEGQRVGDRAGVARAAGGSRPSPPVTRSVRFTQSRVGNCSPDSFILTQMLVPTRFWAARFAGRVCHLGELMSCGERVP